MLGKTFHIQVVNVLAFSKTKFSSNDDSLFYPQDNSGFAFSVIVIIARLSSGGLIMGIQEFYPEDK